MLLSRVTSRPRFSAEEESEIASLQAGMVAGVKTGDGLEAVSYTHLTLPTKVNV